MTRAERKLSIESTIRLIVKNSDDITSNYLAELFGLSKSYIHKLIQSMSGIHRQDDVLYCGERL